MPYKFITDKKLIPKEYDKRVKLSDNDKILIRSLYKEGSISQRKLAEKFNVSRRLIQFVLDPDKQKANYQNRLDRGGSKIYYDKDKQTKAMQKHRKYKKELDDKNLLEEPQWQAQNNYNNNVNQ